TSAGCGAALRELGAHVLDLSEAVASAPAPLHVLRAAGAVAQFDPCHARHAQRLVEPPRALLRALGADVVELDGAGTCCGAAGLQGIAHPGRSRRLRDSRVAAIAASAVPVVACANPGCSLQLRAGLAEAGLAVRVVHPAELAAAALGA